MDELQFGICATPDFLPTSNDLSELNTPYIRSILYHLSDIDRLLSTNRPILITLNNQCAEVHSDWSGWDETVLSLCTHLKGSNKLILLGAGNELDLYWAENGSVPPEFGADLARRTARIAHNFGIKVSATSVAGPRWPEYLQVMADLCRDDVNYFDVHPYGKQPDNWKSNQSWGFGKLSETIETARDITKKPIICSEYGVKIKDAGSEQEVANFLHAAYDTLKQLCVPYTSWFAWHDLVGAPEEQGDQAFGLMSRENKKRPAWFEYMQVNKGVIVPPTNDPLAKWRSTVGKSILDMMLQDGTEPVMASEWRPFDRPAGTPAKVEWCIGINGVNYYWLLDQDKGYRLRPS